MKENFQSHNTTKIKTTTKYVDIKKNENSKTEPSQSSTPPVGGETHIAPPPSQTKSEQASKRPTTNQSPTANQPPNPIYTQEKSPFEMLNTQRK